MIAMLDFATLAIATMFAIATAAGLNWLLLQAAFALMQPATARRIAPRPDLARGTTQLARAFASNR
jgi:hypothetical protein